MAWLFTKAGFFSVVKKGGKPDKPLCIRSRVRGDLENLREMEPSLDEVTEEAGTDYPYRIYATYGQVQTLMALMVEDITYSNFKDVVAKEQGYDRARLYGEVWGVMFNAEGRLQKQTVSYGGRKR